MKAVYAALIFAGTLSASSGAIAQKSKDTVRFAVNTPFTVLSPYNAPFVESSFYYNRVYDSLILRDEHAGKWAPQLAKSWKRIDATTLEFDLRENVKFHNGNQFDADDVVATFEYAGDPNVSLQNKERYTWVKKVEKLGPYKVRVIATEPLAIDLGLIAYRYFMQDKETMDALSDKAEYGRLSPIGTGIYKVALLDKNKGIILDRNDDFSGDKNYSRAPVKRVHGLFLPDPQTQIAELLTDGVDVVGNVSPEQAKDLKSRPNIKIANLAGGQMAYLALDASGRAGNKALTDQKVREAIFMGINRDAIIKYIVPGGDIAEKPDVPCFSSMIGCKYSKTPPAYDPEAAKKLLAEAGYPNGIDLVYDVYTPLKDIAVAISGDLLKIGVRVTVAPMNIQIYRKKQNDISMQAWSFLAPMTSFPDASYSLGLWFQGSRAAYYNEDPVVMKAADAALAEIDPAKRDDIYRGAFDHINDMRYVLPIASIPSVYAYSKDVQILENQRSETVHLVGDFAFK